MYLSQCLPVPGKGADAKHPCKGRASSGCANLRAQASDDSFRGRPGIGTLLLDTQLSMLHLINRRLVVSLSIYKFMNVHKCHWISFSQVTWNDLCHRTGINWYYLAMFREAGNTVLR